MSEGIKVQVPIEIPQPQQQPAQEKPAWARKSLHSVRMPRQEVQLEPQWVNNGPNVEVRYREVEPQPAQSYQPQEVNYMQDQFSGQQPQQPAQQPQGPQLPNPEEYDLYEPMEVVRFQHDNAMAMQAQIDAKLQAALAPHQQELYKAKVREEYNDCQARYGEDENFQEVMDVALANCAEADKAGKRFSIIEEYQRANDKTAARPGRKGNAHLPQEFQDKRRGVGMLGRIMHHNQQTGRASYKKRGW